MRQSARNCIHLTAPVREEFKPIARSSSQSKYVKHTIAALALLALPSVAHANAGTALMQAQGLHLLYGNLLIGVLEGLLLAKLFSLPLMRCGGLLILANYFSAWIGMFFISGPISPSSLIDLNNVSTLLWLIVAATYIATLVLEFPFVALASRGSAGWLRKAILGSLIIQTVSYALLFGWFWSLSGTSLLTQTDVVDLSAMSLPDDVLMYYIDSDDGDVYVRPLAESGARHVFDLNSDQAHDELLVRRSSADSNTWDLVAYMGDNHPFGPILVTIEESFASVAAPSWHHAITDSPEYFDAEFDDGSVPRLGEAGSSPWKFWAGYWPIEGLDPIEGLSGKQTLSGETVQLAIETPFVAWFIRNATHLPTDRVLFQLGDDQLCVYDPENKQIAVITRGRGPVAVIRKEDSNEAIDNDGE